MSIILPNLVSFTGKFTSIFTNITSEFTSILGLDCMYIDCMCFFFQILRMTINTLRSLPRRSGKVGEHRVGSTRDEASVRPFVRLRDYP